MTAEWVTAIAAVPTAIATCFMAGTAWRALDTWKNQTKTQKKLETLDAFLESSYAFISECHSLEIFIKMANIQIESNDHITKDKYEQAVIFLEKNSSSLAEQMSTPLQSVRKHIESVEFLNERCKALNLDEHSRIQIIRNNLVNIFTTYADFHNIMAIGNTVNYDHPKVKKAVENSILFVSAKKISDGLEFNRSAIEEYYKDFFKKTYSNSTSLHLLLYF